MSTADLLEETPADAEPESRALIVLALCGADRGDPERFGGAYHHRGHVHDSRAALTGAALGPAVSAGG